MEIPVEFPLDSDSFLRRQCPSCREHFKWHHGQTATRPDDAVDPTRYSCPLCGRQANHDEWFTDDQVRFQRETVSFYAMDIVNAQMQQAFGRNYTPGKNNAPAPEPLYEPDDMLITEPPCHPWEPVKVPRERADRSPLYCLVCGESYMV